MKTYEARIEYGETLAVTIEAENEEEASVKLGEVVFEVRTNGDTDFSLDDLNVTDIDSTEWNWNLVDITEEIAEVN